MKQRRCTSVSSSSTEASERKYEPNNRKLYRHNWEHCEFCDKLFSNQFDLLTHNVSHIIIPLIKQTTYECEECLYHFTSIEDLAMHISKKHDLSDYTPVKLKNEEEDINDKIPEILQSIVDKQVYVKCGDELNDVFVKANELKMNGFIRNENILENNNLIMKTYLTPKQMALHDQISLKPDPLTYIPNHIDLEIDPTSLKNEPVSPKEVKVRDCSPTETEEESIRHRLLFEEDIEDNLFKDLTTDCKVNIESLFQDATIEIPTEKVNLELCHFDHISNDIDIISDTEYKNNSIYEDRVYKVQEESVSKVQNDTADFLIQEKYEAIHYDILMEAEVCSCRLCGQEYPNRFELLKHEGKHILLKQKQWRSPLCCVCERYIAGNYHNLRRHMEKNHPEKVELEITYATHKCMKCTHQYHNYTKHLRHYHEYYKCKICSLGFDSPKLLQTHECGVNVTKVNIEQDSNKPNSGTDISRSSKESIESRTEPIKSSTRITSSMMQLCEMCYSFMNIYMQNRSNYELIGEKNELGVRQNCDKCNNLFFGVKLVKRKKLRTYITKEIKPRMKHLTNKDRLKKMQNRLKMIKKRNKV